jgi:hypothetical protein
MSGPPAGEVLRNLGMKGILTLPPEKGGIDYLLCDMEVCYCPRSRGYFEPISRDLEGRLTYWMPTEEHWPRGQADGGRRTKGNVWLARRRCNELAYGTGAGTGSAASRRWLGSSNGPTPIPPSTSITSAIEKLPRRAGGSTRVEGPRTRATPILLAIRSKSDETRSERQGEPMRLEISLNGAEADALKQVLRRHVGNLDRFERNQLVSVVKKTNAAREDLHNQRRDAWRRFVWTKDDITILRHSPRRARPGRFVGQPLYLRVS